MTNKLPSPYLLDLCAIIAGAALTLAFAPFDIFPIAILSPAALLALWLKSSVKRVIWRGWLFGLGFFGTGVYWIFISIHTFGNTSIFLASFATSALIAFLALFPAFNGYLLNRHFPVNNNTKILCAFPALWVLLEWMRSWFLSGFPWLFLGYSQLHSPLKGYAPIFSVYGVSLAVALSSALLVNSIIKFRQAQHKSAYIQLFTFALIWILGGCLSFISWTKPVGEPIKVSLVQGNIAQELKWSPDQLQPTLDHYVKLTQPHWDSKIIVWPESAIPVPLHAVADFLNQLNQTARDHQATLITGIPVKAPEEEAYYNSIIALGDGEGIYTKHRLVPFGEYIPLRNLLGRFMDLLQVPMSDFIPGPGYPKPLFADGLKIAAFVCYEIAYPEQVLWRDGDIDMMLTISNDAWFGHSIAQAQHAEIAQMRALEMGRPILFVGNDGITAIINAKGKMQAIAPQYQTYVLTGDVQATQGKTPWQRFAMDPILAIALIMMILAIRMRKRA